MSSTIMGSAGRIDLLREAPSVSPGRTASCPENGSGTFYTAVGISLADLYRLAATLISANVTGKPSL
jgi:hypothetical protein